MLEAVKLARATLITPLMLKNPLIFDSAACRGNFGEANGDSSLLRRMQQARENRGGPGMTTAEPRAVIRQDIP